VIDYPTFCKKFEERLTECVFVMNDEHKTQKEVWFNYFARAELLNYLVFSALRVGGVLFRQINSDIYNVSAFI